MWPWILPLVAIAVALMWYVLTRGEPQSPMEMVPEEVMEPASDGTAVEPVVPREPVVDAIDDPSAGGVEPAAPGAVDANVERDDAVDPVEAGPGDGAAISGEP